MYEIVLGRKFLASAKKLDGQVKPKLKSRTHLKSASSPRCAMFLRNARRDEEISGASRSSEEQRRIS